MAIRMLRRPCFLSILAVLLSVGTAASAGAQRAGLSSTDSELVGRILLAEDRRDASDPSLAVGSSHSDQRIRTIARRAAERINDSTFAMRTTLPPLAAPKKWPDAAWRLRYRALASQGGNCSTIRRALNDASWPVRLRATDVVTPPCGSDGRLVAVLRNWIDALPADVSRRSAGMISWHAAAHALVALGKIQPVEATRHLPKFVAHKQSSLRLYSARAAAVLSDSATLRFLTRDTDANVREAAIQALSKLTRHKDDTIFLAALGASEAQVVRAAALALAASPNHSVQAAANAAFDRWVGRASESERDVRLALLAAAGRPASDDRAPALRSALPLDAISLALGADVRLRVTIASTSGGGSFIVKLRGDAAPITAARILELVQRGYYNGHAWHRVEHDFVIQGGSASANEYVGSDRYFRDELSTLPHVRGTVGMSTRGHDTGDAQWFINLRDNLRLGRDYTVFAEVTEGMGVVDGILEGDVIETIVRVDRVP